MEIRIKPGEHGSSFRLEFWVGGKMVEAQESSHSVLVVRRVETLLDEHEGTFNCLAGWEGSRLPPPGR